MIDLPTRGPSISQTLIDQSLRARLRQRPELITVPLVFVLILIGWEGGVRLFRVETFLLPGPLAILEEFWIGLHSGVFLPHLRTTLTEILVGFGLGALLGIATGAVVAQFRIVERTFMPYLVALQTIPKVAIAPLIVVYFGFGIQSKIVITAMVCFFPIVVNVIEGLQVTDMRQIELLRAMGATRWQIFRMIKVPNSLPFLFTGINVGIVMSVLGAIIGEFVGARSGLGYLILQFNSEIKMAKVFAVVALLAVTGIALHAIVKFIHRRVVFWVKPEDVIGL